MKLSSIVRPARRSVGRRGIVGFGGEGAGFTLVELLVVIGIIALLISILLPSLNKARAAAQSTACLANLQSMGQAMILYTIQYKGAIPGCGNTSSACAYDGSYNLTYTPTTVPGGSPIEIFDYVTPLSQMMGLKLSKASDPSAYNRWVEQVSLKQFQCPAAVAANLVANSFPAGSPDLPVLGYATATGFFLTPGFPAPGKTSYTRVSTGTGWWAPPSGYGPRVNKIGKAAEKVYAADATKYTYQGSFPEYDLSSIETLVSASTGNHSKYSDFGPWTSNTGAYDQWSANGLDGRVMSYRHGKGTRNAPAGSYRMNALFFDGHCDTLDDRTATNPALWLPTGSRITDMKLIPASVQATWSIKAPYVVP